MKAVAFGLVLLAAVALAFILIAPKEQKEDPVVKPEVIELMAGECRVYLFVRKMTLVYTSPNCHIAIR